MAILGACVQRCLPDELVLVLQLFMQQLLLVSSIGFHAVAQEAVYFALVHELGVLHALTQKRFLSWISVFAIFLSDFEQVRRAPVSFYLTWLVSKGTDTVL